MMKRLKKHRRCFKTGYDNERWASCRSVVSRTLSKNFHQGNDSIPDFIIRATAVDEVVKEFNKFHEKICKMSSDLNILNEEILFLHTTLIERSRSSESADSIRKSKVLDASNSLRLHYLNLPGIMSTGLITRRYLCL